MVVAQSFVLVQDFEGLPKVSDFELVTEELPPIGKGEVLSQAEFLSVDPYMRSLGGLRRRGARMPGQQLARVLESQSAALAPGELFVADLGWRSHAVFDPKRLAEAAFLPLFKAPALGALPPSLCLGALGMTGNTAYFGATDACKPKPGSTVAVSGAAGAVGSHVGQLAKVRGCAVVGIAGSDEKVQWLKEDLGFDAAYNYKTTDLAEALRTGAPQGIDVYFDNVGGEISSNVVQHMNKGGRVLIYGSISTYNEQSTRTSFQRNSADVIKSKKINVSHFSVTKYKNRWMEGIENNLKLILDGKIKYRETVTVGFENMPSAFIGMLSGENIGKAVVKCNF